MLTAEPKSREFARKRRDGGYRKSCLRQLKKRLLFPKDFAVFHDELDCLERLNVA